MVNSVKDFYVDLNPFYLIGSASFYQKYKDFISYVERAITNVSLANYLGMRFTFNFEGDFTEKYPSLDECDTVFELIQKCIKKINNRYKDLVHREYDYKFIDSSNKIYSINGISDNDRHRFIFQYIDNNQQTVDSSFIEMTDTQITRMVSLIYAKNENSAKRHIEKQMRDYEDDENIYDPRLYDKTIFILLANCLLLLAEGVVLSNLEYQNHSAFEVSFIRKLIGSNSDQYPIVKAPILTSKKTGAEELFDKYSYSFSFDLNKSLSPLFSQLKDCYEDAPIADLSNKQIIQIQNYVNKKINNPDSSIDFIDVLKHQKFGKIFKINFNKNEEDKKDEFLFTVVDSEIDNHFIIQILYINDKKYDFLFHIYVSKGNEFRKLEEQIESVEVYIYFKDLNSMFSSIVDYVSVLPEQFKEVKNLVILGKIITSMFIMIADNPVKFGAAKAVSHITNRVYKNRKPVEEKKEIVKHIIAFKTTLKERIKEQNSNTSIKREVDYILENWERIGHYRNYKSGKKVWISKTNCHRRLDLSDKKIKVTL